MHPILFQIGSFVMPTYGLFAVLAFLVALLVVRHYAGVEGLDRRRTVDALFFTIVAGVAGARLLEMAVHWERFVAAPKTMLFSTGMFMGGLVSALAFALFWFRRIGLPFLLGFDLVALVAACAIGVGRWGCFASGCCWGTPTELPWAVTFPELAQKIHAGLPGIPLHPTQVYLALNSLAVLGILALAYRRKRFHGRILTLYLMLYGSSRFLLEFLRGDARSATVSELALTRSQLVSLAVVMAGTAGYLYLARRHRQTDEPDWRPARERAAAPPLGKSRSGGRARRRRSRKRD